MASIPTQTLDLGGTCDPPGMVPASLSDDYDCGPGIMALVRVGATATTITLDDPRLNSATRKATTNVILAGVQNQDKWINLPRDLMNANGRCVITCSQIVGVSVAAVQVP